MAGRRFCAANITRWLRSDRRVPRSAQKCCNLVNTIGVTQRNAPLQRGIVWKWDAYPRPLNLSSGKEADRQPLVTTGCGAGYLPTGNLPIGALPTYGAGAGGGGSLRGRSAAAAALSIAKDAAAAVSIFSMMWPPLESLHHSSVRAECSVQMIKCRDRDNYTTKKGIF